MNRRMAESKVSWMNGGGMEEIKKERWRERERKEKGNNKRKGKAGWLVGGWQMEKEKKGEDVQHHRQFFFKDIKPKWYSFIFKAIAKYIFVLRWKISVFANFSLVRWRNCQQFNFNMAG